MNHIIENRYNDIMTVVYSKDSTDRKQITKFVAWLINNDFLDNLSEIDIDDFIEEACSTTSTIGFPLLKRKDITVDFYMSNDYNSSFLTFGMDPTKCWDKLNKSSIICTFPMSKRNETLLYDRLNAIIDRKTIISKDWFKNAASSFYGAYLTI